MLTEFKSTDVFTAEVKVNILIYLKPGKAPFQLIPPFARLQSVTINRKIPIFRLTHVV